MLVMSRKVGVAAPPLRTTAAPAEPPLAKHRTAPVAGENRLLAALPRKEYERLLPWLEEVSFGLKEVVYRCSSPLEYVCFPQKRDALRARHPGRRGVHRVGGDRQ